MSRRIRVLEVVRPSLGGMKKHVQGLVQGLNRDRFEAFLAAPKDETCIQWAARQGVGYVFLEISDRTLSLSDATACLKLRKLIRAIQPDICHFHGFKAAAIGRVAVALCFFAQVTNCEVADALVDDAETASHEVSNAMVDRCPAADTEIAPRVVYTVHNSVLSRSGMHLSAANASAASPTTFYSSAFLGKMCLYAERALARFTHLVITVSKALHQEYSAISGLGPGKVRHIPNGIDLERFLEIRSPDSQHPVSTKRDMGCAAKTQVVGLVSRLIPHKGVKTFLLAIFSLGRMGFTPQVIIAGDGPFRDELEAFAAELGLGDQVRFLGFIEDMVSFYSALDVFVLSSFSEGMPLSVIEAMASGVPVVATRTGGVEEVVMPGAGRLVPPGDPESMAACIRDALLYPEESRIFADRARLHAGENFSLEEMIRKTEEVYEEVLTCPGSKTYH